MAGAQACALAPGARAPRPPGPPEPPQPPDAPRPPLRRALQAASSRPGLSAQRSPGEGRRVPPPGPGAQTGESTRRARSPLPASLPAAACAPRCPSSSPGLGAPRENPPLGARLRLCPAWASVQHTGQPRILEPPMAPSGAHVPARNPCRRLLPAALTPQRRPPATGILTRASRRGRQSRETRKKSTCESFCA